MRRTARRRRRNRPVMKARRRTYRRRNSFNVPGMIANPHRRRRYRRRNPFLTNRRHHRRYRRNPPDILGFNLKDVAIAGAAVIAAPFLAKQINGLLPASMAGTTTGRWAVKIGSAVGVGFLAKKMLGPKTGNLVMMVLGANLVSDAVGEFAPSLTSSGVGFYTTGLAGGGGLGYYPKLRGPSVTMFPAARNAVSTTVIDRLNPASRF